MDPKHYIHELKNGMKVIMVPRKTSGLVYISLVLKNGLLDEDKHTLSFTHAGEHLFAKYTSKKYPRFESVKGRLGFLGIENNAFTTKFNTGYWFLGNKKHLQFLMNLLKDITIYLDYVLIVLYLIVLVLVLFLSIIYFYIYQNYNSNL